MTKVILLNNTISSLICRLMLIIFLWEQDLSIREACFASGTFRVLTVCFVCVVLLVVCMVYVGAIVFALPSPEQVPCHFYHTVRGSVGFRCCTSRSLSSAPTGRQWCAVVGRNMRDCIPSCWFKLMVPRSASDTKNLDASSW